MRQIEYTGQFKRDLKKAKKRGKDMQKIKEPLRLLIEEESLTPVYRDHLLTGVGVAISILNQIGC